MTKSKRELRSQSLCQHNVWQNSTHHIIGQTQSHKIEHVYIRTPYYMHGAKTAFALVRCAACSACMRHRIEKSHDRVCDSEFNTCVYGREAVINRIDFNLFKICVPYRRPSIELHAAPMQLYTTQGTQIIYKLPAAAKWH